MSFIELFILAVGLSMDAFAVAICKGLSAGEPKTRHYICVGLYFGGFQMLMPLTGWAAGQMFSSFITTFDHWVAFILLGYIGIKMILDAVRGEEESSTGNTNFRVMLLLAVATSIDALAAGITFAFMSVNIWFSIAVIGSITFCLSTFGALIGKRAGDALGKHAQIVGGVILIAMGVKILIEHMLG